MANEDVDWSRVNRPTAELITARLSPSERARSVAQDALIALGANPYNAGRLADGLMGLVQASPLAVPLGAADLAYYKSEDNPTSAALAAASMIPGAKAAKGVAKKVAQTTGDTAVELFNTSRLHEVPDVKQFDLPRYQPPRGVPPRTQELLNNPDVRDKMIETIKRGQEMGGAKWYNAEPLREAFNAELGKGGDAAFRQYMDMVAATSPRSDVGTNVRNASYYYTLARQGQPMPAVGTPNPQPYGHLAQKEHQRNAAKIVGAGWDPLQNPKPASFVENLAGNQMPATVDTHAFRLPAMLAQDPRFIETSYKAGKDIAPRNIQKELQQGKLSMDEVLDTPAFWQAQPRDNEYAAMEQYYKQLGADLGLTPAQTQASAWVGGGPITGLASDSSKAFVDFVQDRAVKTAQERGITPAEALSQMISGKAPLLSVGGAAAVPYLLSTQDEGDM